MGGGYSARGGDDIVVAQSSSSLEGVKTRECDRGAVFVAGRGLVGFSVMVTPGSHPVASGGTIRAFGARRLPIAVLAERPAQQSIFVLAGVF